MDTTHTVIIVLLAITILLQLYSLYCKNMKKEDYGSAGPGQSCSSGSDCASKKCDKGKCT